MCRMITLTGLIHPDRPVNPVKKFYVLLRVTSWAD